MALDKMARDYMEECARLRMRIEMHRRKGDLPPGQMAMMRRMLEDLRMTQHTLACYYNFPRPGVVDASSWRAGGHRADDS